MPFRMKVFFFSVILQPLRHFLYDVRIQLFSSVFLRTFKPDLFVDKVKIIHVNLLSADALSERSEVRVFLLNLTPCLQKDTADEKPGCPSTSVNDKKY